MVIHNIMEDIVLSSVAEIIKDEKNLIDATKYVPDITAYVLNRIPPKYVTSERGILHGKLESKYIFQQRTDIIFLIHEAINVIRTRSAEPRSGVDDSRVSTVKFFPHVIGEVLEETTFSIISDVKVTILHKDKSAVMMDQTWINPFITNKGTAGYYHFWPAVVTGSMEKAEMETFTIRFEHEKFIEKEITIDIPVVNEIDISTSRAVPIVLLKLKEGVDVSFLYE